METWAKTWFDNNYEVSTFGRIRTLDRLVNVRNGVRLSKGKILVLKNTANGYLFITSSNHSKTKNRTIHRLVAIAFIPNPENKKTVNHKNGDKTDNRVENLEWATNSENSLHSYMLGTQISKKGKENHRSKIVLNTNTGIFYDTLFDAANSIGMKNYNLGKRLMGTTVNDTPFVYA